MPGLKRIRIMPVDNIIAKPEIDPSKCTLCGRCVSVCPKDVLLIKEKKVSIENDDCMLCSHCYGVCVPGAISFPWFLKQVKFNSFKYREKLLSGKDHSPAEIINIFRSRRSVRKFREEPVDDDVLRDLVEFAVTAPSGSNCQEWEFTVVNGREKVWDLAQQVKSFFVKINNLAANPVVRLISIPFVGRKLVSYYRDHYETVKRAIRESNLGIDRLFHGAPCVIVIHSPMDGSTPVEDGTYAAYNICMLAHYTGLGTCLIGFAVEAINGSSELKDYLDIYEKNRVHAVIAIGKPAVKYSKHSLRKDYTVEFL